jgi:hypothetical protein
MSSHAKEDGRYFEEEIKCSMDVLPSICGLDRLSSVDGYPSARCELDGGLVFEEGKLFELFEVQMLQSVKMTFRDTFLGHECVGRGPGLSAKKRRPSKLVPSRPITTVGVLIYDSEVTGVHISVLKKDMDKLLQENGDLHRELELYKERVLKLDDMLEKRTGELKKLVHTVEELTERFEKSDQRLEMQQIELIEQKVCMREFCLSLQMIEPSLPSFIQTTTTGEYCKQFWILRKHQRNLITITKPYIHSIIKASTEAGIVSRNIGKCAIKCSIPNHDCASGFYKALLVRVGKSPHVLRFFLQILLNEFETGPCRQLCIRMLDELSD